MSRTIDPLQRFRLVIFVLALFPAECFAMSPPNVPCDVGNGYFFYLPDRSDEWQIYFEDKTSRIICYDVGWQEAFRVLWLPYYDFDEKCVYIKVEIKEPKFTEPPKYERTKRIAYFIFNKETREMSAPLTPDEFSQHPAVTKKLVFDWKRGDQKNTGGFLWFALPMLFFLLGGPYILLAILLGILGKWAYERMSL